MRNYSDQILFKKIKLGNEIAFKKLFDKYYYQLCMYARTIVKKNECAEEVVEDVFCKIWQKKDQIEIRVSLKTYLFKSVYNTSLNFLKSEKA